VHESDVAQTKLVNQKNKRYIVKVFPAWLGLDTFSEQAGFTLKKNRRAMSKSLSFFFRKIKKRCPFLIFQFVALET
jgi:hypothetical protein